ncbi:OmpH family outer membrane protein [Psychroflexus planctonicus]|uniref:Membrane protein n=1 Tax=Psychroflexus planctonicus TaxID=1526575 RepID=A0ABQ1SGR5_9FLAO|nr:OmpH family outer membrane protein [Psychroflexus planctonicus]GGE38774.1 membrane protein [Psychroflexus planctonicus]
MSLNSFFKLVFLTLISLNLSAQRGNKIGYVDMDYILENVPEFQQSLSLLDAKAQKWSGELAKKKAEIDQLKEELENERPLLTIELIEEKEEEIEYLTEKMFEFQDEKFGVGGELLVQKRQLVQPIQDQVFNAIQEIGENRSYDFIFENSSEALMLFSAKRHDLSDIVLKLIQRSAKQNAIETKGDEDELFGEEYKSVEQAEEDEKKEAEEEAKKIAREKEREEMIEERLSTRDSIRAARKKEYEERKAKLIKDREEAQRKRDSIRKARENN